jgi:glycine dehydrogenase subunit 1
MTYVLNTPDEQRVLLEAIGVKSIDELFAMIPAELRLQGNLKLPRALSEMELTSRMAELGNQNAACSQRVCFLGAGSYDHFIPAVVDAIASRSEFYTSYTPYQPEVSQGNLRALFEYQTLVTQLTGMDVSNASLYDGGSAVAEGALMALSATGRRRLVVLRSVHPEYRQVLATYLANLEIEIVEVPVPMGTADREALARELNDQTAAVIVQQPNFFGCLEEVRDIAGLAHKAGALVIASVDPISLGLLERPGEWGADIVVAEGQSLGSPLAFGGPYLGMMACRESLVRRMPGRIAGETVDRSGRRCYVLTLQTREQHIRREKATSNICTNQGLLALRATVYLASLGPQGLRETAELCVQKSHYASRLLDDSERFSLRFERPFFKEFVVQDASGQVAHVLEEATEAGIFAGIALGTWYPELKDCFLVAVTEKRTRDEIERWSIALSHGSGLPLARGAVVHA